MEEQNPRLTIDLAAITNRIIRSIILMKTAALRFWLQTSGPTSIYLDNIFSRRACPGNK